jgi:hypothetical protein
MLYKHTTQKLYKCDPQTQLNNFFALPKNFTTCFGPSWPSSGDIFEDFSEIFWKSKEVVKLSLQIIYV